ncbi:MULTISPECIES: RICIN domain-containing protein [Paenibacillus]|uniref:RICIN domain-containing protein n=1 Tax=Paenibacillus TaxID=44249 RepID=UPI0022B8DFBE|nr:RICIN domain-containing protein [Paenibacillus caseinilyticus]MCZ8518382.1 RICIN domain-containing protein [Paenibacillus caseinilyticus]
MKKIKLLLMICFIVVLFFTSSAATFASTSVNIGSDVIVNKFNTIDVDPGISVDPQGNLWFVYSDGSSIWHIFKGTTMDNLVEQYSFNAQNAVSNGFSKPNGDDRYWPSGLWIVPESGRFYTTVHVEFNYGSWRNQGYTGPIQHFRRIGVAYSDDHGRTWTYQGDIITSQHPTNPSSGAYPDDSYNYGVGDQKLFVDLAGGYYYVYYQTAWLSKNQDNRQSQIKVARSPLGSNMAPGSWKKYFNGSWNEPGIGGQDSVALPGNVNDSGVVVWNSYLNKYMAITNGDGGGNIAIASDLNKQDWSSLGRFADRSRIQWYNFPVDSSNARDRMIVGKTFRLYSAQNNYDGIPTKYMDVTIESDDREQKFEQNAFYRIINQNSGKALELLNGAGQNIIQWDIGGDEKYYQQWKIQETGKGFYNIINRQSNRAMAVDGGYNNNFANGKEVIQWEYGNWILDQQWTIMDIGSGRYRLINNNSQKSLGIAGSYPTNLNNAQHAIQWDSVPWAGDQQWRIEKVPN